MNALQYKTATPIQTIPKGSFMDDFFALLQNVGLPTWAYSAVTLSLLFLAAYLIDRLTTQFLMRFIRGAITAIPGHYKEALLDYNAINRLAHVVPALVIYLGIGHIPGLPAGVITVTHNVINAYMIVTVALSIGSVLSAIDGIYVRLDPARASQKPIKGYLQLLKIIGFILAGILSIAALIDRSPLILLSGLGAMTAVLMLVFKDTILSFVAAVQLASNDVVRIGDWLEMPALNADGAVMEIALHTVKVQNWDKTITTIPTWRLINEPFKNWRGMSESGGRRIMRSVFFDQTSVHFLTESQIQSLRRFALLEHYLDQKQHELQAFNQELLSQGKDPVNARRLTNIGTFRIYVLEYLKANTGIHQDMTMIVRQLQPTATGLPLQIYCFTNSTEWIQYEKIQSDLFDHLYAIIPEFGLRLFQEPTGYDMQHWSGHNRS
jgi:miniconductance mechanosensitive channel